MQRGVSLMWCLYNYIMFIHIIKEGMGLVVENWKKNLKYHCFCKNHSFKVIIRIIYDFR